MTEEQGVVNEKTTVPSTDVSSDVTWADVVKGKTRMNEVRTIEKETHGKRRLCREHFLETIPSTKTEV